MKTKSSKANPQAQMAVRCSALLGALCGSCVKRTKMSLKVCYSLLSGALLLCLRRALRWIEGEHTVDLFGKCVAKLRSVTAPHLGNALHKALCYDPARAASCGRELHEDLTLLLTCRSLAEPDGKLLCNRRIVEPTRKQSIR